MPVTLKDKLWIWGQNPNTHHGNGNPWRLPGENRMTPLEGCCYLGIPNCCRVGMSGLPKPPFDQDAMVLDTLDRVVWSILGDTHSGNDVYLDEVLRIARKHPNVVGAVMDDFICTPGRSEIYTPQVLREYRERLHQELSRKLDLWVVAYEYELDKPIKASLDECDVITFWTRNAANLTMLEENYRRLREIVGENKSVLMGCYMWDYGAALPMPMDLMQYQLDVYHNWLHEGKIDGIIFCSNCIADLDLKAVDYTRDWIREHAMETLK